MPDHIELQVLAELLNLEVVVLDRTFSYVTYTIGQIGGLRIYLGYSSLHYVPVLPEHHDDLA